MFICCPKGFLIVQGQYESGFLCFGVEAHRQNSGGGWPAAGGSCGRDLSALRFYSQAGYCAVPASSLAAEPSLAEALCPSMRREVGAKGFRNSD